MESILFPTSITTPEDRINCLLHALNSVAELPTSSPLLYVVYPLGILHIKEWFAQLSRAISELKRAVARREQQARHRTVTARLVPLFSLECSEDLTSIRRWRATSTKVISLMNAFEAMFVHLSDPTLLEEPKVTLITLLNAKQQLYLVIDDTLRPRFTGRQQPDSRDAQQWLSPSAFSLPPSKLPKGRVALHLSYSHWMRLLRDGLVEETSKQLRRVASELIRSVRLPLITSYCGEWKHLEDGQLRLRALSDLYPLLGAMMFGNAQSSLFDEAKSFVRKGENHCAVRDWVASWDAAVAQDQQLKQRPTVADASRGRRKRARDESCGESPDEEKQAVPPTTTTAIVVDDLELIEDANCS